jgi:hypothetical protein
VTKTSSLIVIWWLGAALLTAMFIRGGEWSAEMTLEEWEVKADVCFEIVAWIWLDCRICL